MVDDNAINEVEEVTKDVEGFTDSEGLAIEILRELKDQNKALNRINCRQTVIHTVIIIIVILCLVGQSVYHEYLWSQYETVVVDSKDGGNANYIGRDGSVDNGKNKSAPEEER